ncbi:MAG: hypothetical protein RSA45_00410 [Hydrogenoanaerobacterium sp.]
MRVTHNMLTRNYLKNLNNNMTNLSKSNERMTSQRKFNTASENVADASRALRVRVQLTNNEVYKSNVRDAKGKFTMIEDSMQSINKITQNVAALTVQGLNGTMAPEEKEKIAREIETLQDQILQVSNSRFGDKYIFGAAGNKDGSAPYTLGGADGKQLMYNGTIVDDMVKGTGVNTGKVMVADATAPGGFKEIPYNSKNYLDIGLGFTVKNGYVDPRTALEYSVSGVESLGFGKTENGSPNNLYGILGSIAQNLRDGNSTELGQNLKSMNEQSDQLLMHLSTIGTRTAYIEQIDERLGNSTFSLQKIQNDLEAVPIQEESIYNKDYEMSWMVTLQMGAKILPTSIFDFLR